MFDVARGELPITTSVPSTPGGDFSAAICLENDDVDLSATDADTPAAGSYNFV